MMKNIIEKTVFNHPVQEALFKSFEKTGLPNRRNDNYRYSQMTQWFKSSWQNNVTSEPSIEKTENTLDLVIGNNGEILTSDIEYKEIHADELKFAKNQRASDPLKNLSLAKLEKIYQIELKDHQKLKISYVLRKASHMNSFIQIISNGETSITENFEQVKEKSLLTSSLNVLIDSGKCHYFRIDHTNESSCHYSYPYFHLNSKESFLEIKQLVMGKGLQRFAPEIFINHENTNVDFQTFYHLSSQGSLEMAARIEHLKENTFSTQEAIGILNEQAKALFTGRIYIDHHCQGVEANQFNKNILIGEKAQALSQPQLEIFNDDVKCSHGSTTGQISSQELFYLQSRGISKARASQILMNALAEKFFLSISDDVFAKECRQKYQEFNKDLGNI